MNRREMLNRVVGAVSAISVASLASGQEPQPEARYGLMTIDRWHAEGFYPDGRVLLDGVDITNRCRWFDDRTGEACVMGEDGPSLGPDRKLQTVILCGRLDVRTT